ncbi:hypothetical protein AB2C23_33405, partial [Pseudomonas aeruginosa]
HAEGLAETGRAEPETVARLKERRQSVSATARPAVQVAFAAMPRFVASAIAPFEAPASFPVLPAAAISQRAALDPFP